MVVAENGLAKGGRERRGEYHSRNCQAENLPRLVNQDVHVRGEGRLEEEDRQDGEKNDVLPTTSNDDNGCLCL